MSAASPPQGGPDEGPANETLPRSRPRPADRPREAARLIAIYPPELRATIPLAGDHTLLGRTADEGVVGLLHGTVSRRHLAVEWDAGAGLHRARDLGSRNGSWVDGADARGGLPLRDGSVVRAADVLLIYERALLDEDAAEVCRDAVPGEAAAMGRLRARLARAARDAAPVLLIGETGTGKERIAAEIHRLSGRSGPYLTVNCAALSPQLIESQLFGHTRGAFTGAGEAQPGLFRSAAGGTVLLDEIGELPLDLQPKLLRTLQEGEVHPVGSPRPVRVDVRVVAATHRDLAAAADSGAFRRDLHARLALWEIAVPALRQRRADLLSWLQRLGGSVAFDPDAAERLLLSAWPTNLRGLDRLLHDLGGLGARARPVAVNDLPAWLGAPPPQAGPASAPAPGRPAAPTREEFIAAFERLSGSVHALARHFGRDRRQIYRWLEAHGLRERL